jgi:hypothetical protein
MLWLINQATAGELSMSSGGAPAAARAAHQALAEENRKGLLSAGDTSFHDFKIDMNA